LENIGYPNNVCRELAIKSRQNIKEQVSVFNLVGLLHTLPNIQGSERFTSYIPKAFTSSSDDLAFLEGQQVTGLVLKR
jgi:hypothetical protein